jgi:hypothetical protein
MSSIKVRLDQPALRRLVAQVLAPGERALLLPRQQRTVADLADVELERVLRLRRRIEFDVGLVTNLVSEPAAAQRPTGLRSAELIAGPGTTATETPPERSE